MTESGCGAAALRLEFARGGEQGTRKATKLEMEAADRAAGGAGWNKGSATLAPPSERKESWAALGRLARLATLMARGGRPLIRPDRPGCPECGPRWATLGHVPRPE